VNEQISRNLIRNRRVNLQSGISNPKDVFIFRCII